MADYGRGAETQHERCGTMTSANDFDVVGREPGNGPERCDYCGSRKHETGLCPLLEGVVEVESDLPAGSHAYSGPRANAGDAGHCPSWSPSSDFSIAEIDALVTSGEE